MTDMNNMTDQEFRNMLKLDTLNAFKDFCDNRNWSVKDQIEAMIHKDLTDAGVKLSSLEKHCRIDRPKVPSVCITANGFVIVRFLDSNDKSFSVC